MTGMKAINIVKAIPVFVAVLTLASCEQPTKDNKAHLSAGNAAVGRSYII
jgi:hypothetical protein